MCAETPTNVLVFIGFDKRLARPRKRQLCFNLEYQLIVARENSFHRHRQQLIPTDRILASKQIIDTTPIATNPLSLEL